MLVGSKFRTVKSSTWAPVVGLSLPLPRKSLLVLDGNSANIAKHCIRYSVLLFQFAFVWTTTHCLLLSPHLVSCSHHLEANIQSWLILMNLNYSSCSGPRISITLRKQPPPDWKPDVSELKGGSYSEEVSSSFFNIEIEQMKRGCKFEF